MGFFAIDKSGMMYMFMEIFDNIYSGSRRAKNFSDYFPRIVFYLWQFIAALLPMARIPVLENVVNTYYGIASCKYMKLFKKCLIIIFVSTIVFPLMLLALPIFFLEIRVIDRWLEVFESKNVIDS